MTQEEMQAELNTRVQTLLATAKDLEIEIFAVQQLDKEGYLQTIPMFRNLKKYPVKAVKAKKK